jgi:N-acetylmuramoyl-L-alanine amidase
VLLELGYLSNPKDEELLRDAQWRSKAADNIIRAIDLFAEAKGGTGG